MFLLLDEMRRRKNATYRLDELIIEKIAEHAKNNNISANKWLEEYLFNSLKSMGIIETSEIPIGESRGGDRRSQDYKKDN
jgi:hypothetical protein